MNLLLEPFTPQIHSGSRPASRSTSATSPPDLSIFLNAAGEIAADLCRNADVARDGRASWSLARQDDGELRRVPLGPHLGSGVLGVAVFLAAFDRVLGESVHRGICLGAVAPLRREIAGLRSWPAGLAPGGMGGIGSVIYGLLVLGDLLEEPGLAADAARLCRLLDPARVREETRLDVMFGLAGLLLSLLAFDADEPLAIAALCAERLAAAPLSSSGFSHGAAGVSFALSRFARRTGDPRARQAAEGSLAVAERGLAGEARSWCNGAAGLHLACLAAGRTAPLERLADEPGLYDHLCCGFAGRADVLAHAARQLGDPQLLAAARGLGAALLERHRDSALRFPHPEILFEPRLLRGPTGVGYAFLRLADPDAVPCLLAFESRSTNDVVKDRDSDPKRPGGALPAGAPGDVPGSARGVSPPNLEPNRSKSFNKEVHHGQG